MQNNYNTILPYNLHALLTNYITSREYGQKRKVGGDNKKDSIFGGGGEKTCVPKAHKKETEVKRISVGFLALFCAFAVAGSLHAASDCANDPHFLPIDWAKIDAQTMDIGAPFGPEGPESLGWNSDPLGPTGPASGPRGRIRWIRKCWFASPCCCTDCPSSSGGNNGEQTCEETGCKMCFRSDPSTECATLNVQKCGWMGVACERAQRTCDNFHDPDQKSQGDSAMFVFSEMVDGPQIATVAKSITQWPQPMWQVTVYPEAHRRYIIDKAIRINELDPQDEAWVREHPLEAWEDIPLPAWITVTSMSLGDSRIDEKMRQMISWATGGRQIPVEISFPDGEGIVTTHTTLLLSASFDGDSGLWSVHLEGIGAMGTILNKSTEGGKESEEAYYRLFGKPRPNTAADAEKE